MGTQPRRALITGVSGQDGSFLAELLLEKGYEVRGLVHGDSRERSLGCSEHLRERIALLGGDLLEPASLRMAIERARLGWEPRVSFEQLVERMVEADLRALRVVARHA